MSVRLVAVASFETIAEAGVVQALLEADGIRVLAGNEGHVRMLWPMSQALGGVQLLVPAEREADARALVDAYRRGELAIDNEQGDPPPPETCPRCGGMNVAPRVANAEKALLVLAFAALNLLWPTRSTQRDCGDCGHRY